MREDMRAHAVFTEIDDLGSCKEVAEACPVGAITIRPISNSGLRLQSATC